MRAIHLLGSRTVFFVCLLLAITTGFGAARELWFSRTGIEVEGLVVREVEELTADWAAPAPSSAAAAAIPGVQTAAATRVYRAVVRFRDSGRPFDWHEMPAQLTSTARLYPVGTKVDVVYPAGAPAWQSCGRSSRTSGRRRGYCSWPRCSGRARCMAGGNRRKNARPAAGALSSAPLRW